MKDKYIIKKRTVYDIYDTKRGWFVSSHRTLKEAEEELKGVENENA